MPIDWKQKWKSDKAERVRTLKAEREKVEDLLASLDLDAIKRRYQSLRSELNDKKETVETALKGIDPEKIKVLKEYEGLVEERRRLLEVNELFLMAIQAKELDALLDHSIASGNLEAAVGAMLGLEGLVTMARGGLGQDISALRDKHGKSLCELLPRKLAEDLKRCKWPSETVDDALLDTVNLMANLQAVCRFDIVGLLVEPVRLHFLFHFCTDRPTNKLSKPEWPLGYLQSTLAGCQAVLVGDILPLIPGSSPIEFVRAVAQIGIDRLVELKPVIGGDLVARYVKEAAAFERELFDAYGVQVGVLDCFLSEEGWISSALRAFELDLKEMLEAQSLDLQALFETHFVRLLELLDGAWRQTFFLKAFVPAMQAFHSQLAFHQPAFLTGIPDFTAIAHSIGLLDGLEHCIDRWSDSLWMLELVKDGRFTKEVGYDASSLHGLALHKALLASAEMRGSLMGKLQAAIFDRYSAGMGSFISSMHYALPGYTEDASTEKAKTTMCMHDAFRKTLLDLDSTLAALRSALPAALFSDLTEGLAKRVEDHLIDRLILRNYFHEAGAEQFGRDVSWLIGLFRQFSNAERAFLRTEQCVKLLQLPKDKSEAAMIGEQQLRRTLESGNMSEIIAVMHRLEIEELTVEECEQVLASRRFE